MMVGLFVGVPIGAAILLGSIIIASEMKVLINHLVVLIVKLDRGDFDGPEEQ